VRPAYRNVIEPLDLRASGVRWPGPAIEQLRLDARTTGGAKLAVTGSLRAGAADVTAKVDALPLAPLSPYAAGTGYGVAGGSASLDAKLSMKGDAYDASSRLVLSQLAVSGEQGEALFQQQFGIPLSLALALLTDLEGNITLDVPVTGDRRGTSVGIGSLVGQALTKAILGAITSPLKMIMAVATADGKVASATPQSIRFRPGRAQLAQGGEELLAQLAALLGRSPGLRIELTGRAGAEDERWLREQSLRAEIERSSGFLGSVLNVGELGEREAVLPVLEKRAADEPADVPAEAQDWFDRRVAEQALAPGRIGELAAARAELVRTTLVEQHGIATERIARAPADASATGAQAPEVALTLGAAQR
jgi:outer membrane protein OmpA-like peptidoglycan-associated protein